ncbi:hypothetical protein TPA2_gp60 [Tsukamurella phage TPA2]|uniref:hypothetical protein n=1 Tax=Tsukamurella phage TPA2 TaxID=981330 RepID=UPI0001FF8DD3|nr:hypothetical protein TPA2_gp60 [Tsukamurella phage TPA2]ADX31974.1 hypothetical protein [Tsukamurella phage TPA2]
MSENPNPTIDQLIDHANALIKNGGEATVEIQVTEYGTAVVIRDERDVEIWDEDGVVHVVPNGQIITTGHGPDLPAACAAAKAALK